MSNSETLDDILGVDPNKTIVAAEATEESSVPAVIEGEALPAPVDAPSNSAPLEERELEDDFQFARKNVRELVSQSRQALDSAVMLAQSGDSPRAYEVVGKMLENIVNANRELVELHKTKKLTKDEPKGKQSLLPTGEPQSPGVNIEKAVFVGRTSDLLREIKAIQKQQKAAADEAAAQEAALITVKVSEQN